MEKQAQLDITRFWILAQNTKVNFHYDKKINGMIGVHVVVSKEQLQ